MKYADNLVLLHLSSCLMLEKGRASATFKALQGKCPLSGYATSVEWAASALTEFLYLDLVLSKGHSAERAAEQVVRQLAFSGEKGLLDSSYAPAGFRFYAKDAGEEELGSDKSEELEAPVLWA